MNEERYILARFIRELMAQDAKSRKERSYGESWTISEICQIIEQIRADAVLGEPESALPWDMAGIEEGKEVE